ncbi:MAG: hypothetical protein HYY93_06640 [Planctomycetes bacterium]|nr:hypothetical protein [Planctomycetota bacterium]
MDTPRCRSLWPTLSLAAALIGAGCTNPEISTRTPRPDEETFGRSHQERPHPATERNFENVQIDVEVVEVQEAEAAGFEGLWQGVDETVLGGGVKDAYAKNGLRLGLGGTRFAPLLDATILKTKGRTRSLTSVTTPGGRPASIAVGETILEPVSIVVWNAATVSESHSVQRAAFTIEVTPTVLDGGRIRIDLLPRLAHSDPAAKAVPLTELSASLIVREGTPLVIGRFGAEPQTIGTTFLKAHGGGAQSTMWLVLTPRPLR